MIDWEEVIQAKSEDELKELKLWLFRESVRIANEQKALDSSRDKFIEERVAFREEMNTLNRRSILERKRLKEESAFFDKKMEILKNGFQQLEADRKAFERQKRAYLEKQEKEAFYREVNSDPGNIAEALFRNVNNPLALRKRYRDLVKIFHPDNPGGDEEIARQINKEFLKRRKDEFRF